MSAPVVNPPNLSPSLGEYDEGTMIDPDGNVIPVVALLHIDPATGANELHSAADGVITPGIVSQVTGKRGRPMVTIPGFGQVPALGVLNVSPAVTGASKSGGKFQSADRTATGSAESIAHGLGVVPTLVLAAVQDNTASGSTPFTFQITEGTHTSTNIVITVTAGAKYKVIAFV